MKENWKIITIVTIIMSIVLFLTFSLVTAVSNDIKDNGGLGKSIGKFIGEIQKGIKETN